jgi:uncharacterized protein (DUF433 family)
MHEELITIDPAVCHGKPCIRGTRILVSSILSQLAGGYDFSRVKAGYPELTDEHILAALEYAGRPGAGGDGDDAA